MINIYAAQGFVKPESKAEEVWRTIYMSTSITDSLRAYQFIEAHATQPVRLVTFTVSDLDFLGTECRDFKVLYAALDRG